MSSMEFSIVQRLSTSRISIDICNICILKFCVRAGSFIICISSSPIEQNFLSSLIIPTLVVII